jgi:hypothetical protein
MEKYFNARITNEDGIIKVWIDQNDAICIEQPFNPEKEGQPVWQSEEEALTWANSHITTLMETVSQDSKLDLIESKLDELLLRFPQIN